jgi:hypothetical protein
VVQKVGPVIAVAKIMAEMLFEVMNPLYTQHPSIKPLEIG